MTDKQRIERLEQAIREYCRMRQRFDQQALAGPIGDPATLRGGHHPIENPDFFYAPALAEILEGSAEE